MPKFHQQSKHSYLSVRKNPRFLDWRTQPRSYKLYPHFYQRFEIEGNLNLIGKSTFSKSYPDGLYQLRTSPSAGGLYPFEVYIQIRGVKGYLDGIYHYEPLNEKLTLLNEIERDGVEFYFRTQNRERGFIFLISSVYFRSSWKYGDRAIRYILLDSGHQLASIYSAITLDGRDSKVIFDFEKVTLNRVFGFREDEFFMVALKSTIESEKKVENLKQLIPYVAPTDYLEDNQFIQKAYSESVDYQADDVRVDFLKNIDRDILKNAIERRRSIRAFRAEYITLEEFNFIIDGIFEFAMSYNIEIFYTLHRVATLEEGLYRANELVQVGNFQNKSRYLSLEQNLASESSFTLYFTSNSIDNYQQVYMLSGFLAHIIYLRATAKNIGVSGIGAYYDDETKQFLNTKNNILYLLAVGR